MTYGNLIVIPPGVPPAQTVGTPAGVGRPTLRPKLLRGSKESRKLEAKCVQNTTQNNQNGYQMAPKVIKIGPKSDQDGAMGCHGAPFGDMLGQKGPHGGHKVPIVVAMVAQREAKGSPNGDQNGQKTY